MSLQLEFPHDFPLDAFRALSQASPDQQELIRRYMQCSVEIQSVVRSMVAILESPAATPEARHRALVTIADALSLHPDPSRLSQLDSQEATFSERLRKVLEQKNITQEELADRVGCTQPAVSKMLSRKARPHRSTIFKMAAALDVTPTELWPDLEVAAILDSIAEFPQERELTPQQAEALEAAGKRPPVKIEAKDLPSRQDQ